MSSESKSVYPAFELFPMYRLSPGFPWQIWAAGWLAVFKALTWLATDPNVSKEILEMLGMKYMAFTLPFLIFGIGIWNVRRWAIRGLLLTCIAELSFFVLYPASLGSLKIDSTSMLSQLLSCLVFIINGPLSSILILAVSPAYFKYPEKAARGKK